MQPIVYSPCHTSTVRAKFGRFGRNLAITFFAFSTFFGPSGCSDRCISPAVPREVRIAINPWPGYALFYLAEEKGFFEEEGLSVRLVELASLADARRVFEHGQTDLICCTLVEVLMMNDAVVTDPVKSIHVFDYSNGSDMLVAREDLTTVASLRGARIGLEPESVDCLAVNLALQSAGLSIGDVTLVALAQSEMRDALQSGQVDAVQTYPPGSEAISQVPGVHTLWDTSNAPGVILDVLAARQSFLNEQPQAIRGLIRAYQRAQDYYSLHPQEALATLSRRCGLDQHAMQRFLGGMKMLNIDGEETRKIFSLDGSRDLTARVAQGLIAAGMLEIAPQEPPFDGRFAESPPR